MVVLTCCPEALCVGTCVFCWACSESANVLCCVSVCAWEVAALWIVFSGTRALVSTLMYGVVLLTSVCPSVLCIQDQPPPQPPPANAPAQSDTGAAAAFEVEGPSLQELLEKPIQSNGKLIISSEQLKQLALLLDNPVRTCQAHEGRVVCIGMLVLLFNMFVHPACICAFCVRLYLQKVLFDILQKLHQLQVRM